MTKLVSTLALLFGCALAAAGGTPDSSEAIGLLVAIIILLIAFGSLIAAGVLPAEPAIEGAIQGQIEAFQADDFDEAFTFASPNIQMLFRDADNFGSMVKNGYPMVWRPDEFRFLELREIAGNLWQKILVRDAAGTGNLRGSLGQPRRRQPGDRAR